MRYRLGDVLTARATPCACGRHPRHRPYRGPLRRHAAAARSRQQRRYRCSPTSCARAGAGLAGRRRLPFAADRRIVSWRCMRSLRRLPCRLCMRTSMRHLPSLALPPPCSRGRCRGTCRLSIRHRSAAASASWRLKRAAMHERTGAKLGFFLRMRDMLIGWGRRSAWFTGSAAPGRVKGRYCPKLRSTA